MHFKQFRKFCQTGFLVIAQVIADVAAEVGLAEVGIVIGVGFDGLGEVGKAVGFGSAEFWQDEYGLAVGGLVNEMAAMINDQLRCQPFMTRISRVEGKTIHFLSGASSGVRPGDKLSLYRTYNFYDADLLKGVELTNVKTALTVSQVHPGFASGKISVDPGRLNIQVDDLLVAW